MKILFITDAFNGMSQRLWIELDHLNHDVQVLVYTGNEKRLFDKVRDYQPDLIIAPYLTRKIPTEIWQNYVCLIVHPGIKGDRGASSLDWAFLRDYKQWGVTILQAVEKMDAGPVWASHEFEMRPVSKSELYRCEVTQTAAKGILEAVEKFQSGIFIPETINPDSKGIKGTWNRKTRQEDYAFSWNEPVKDIIKKINAADSTPGVKIELYGENYFCYGVTYESKLKGLPGEILAQREQAVCIACKDGAVWLAQLKKEGKQQIKLPATVCLGEKAEKIPESPLRFKKADYPTRQEIYYEIENGIGYLHFDFYNGAMDTYRCRRLTEALKELKQQTQIIVLAGGRDLWSNGIHLNIIEHSDNPAQTSWENIQAIDDLILELILSTDHYIISALQGNAGAGGVSLALAADKVLCREGIVLNPHTKNMGLFGSEYWTYLLPKRIGFDKAKRFTNDCLPWGVQIAYEIGMIDGYFGQTPDEFMTYVKEKANEVKNLKYFDKLLKAKRFQRMKDERNKPLERYRKEELVQMRLNFFDDNWQYNRKRFCFVHKIPDTGVETFENLYRNRREIYRKRKWEKYDYED